MTTTPTGEIEFFKISKDARTLPVALWSPPNRTPGSKLPLIIFLHGSGESGTDGMRQLAQGLPLELNNNPLDWQAVILMPQKPSSDIPWQDYNDLVMHAVDQVIASHSIDQSRITITGLSQGGAGTWHLARAMNNRIAGIAPICGFYGTRTMREVSPAQAAELARDIKHIPTWAFHGDADDVVPPIATTQIIDAIKASGGEPRLTIYPGVNHNSWTQTYRDVAFRSWLLSQRLPGQRSGAD